VLLSPARTALALLTLFVSASMGPAAADVIDLGAQKPQAVHFFADPFTFVRIPPGAFGNFPPGTLAQLILDSPTCNGPYCVGGQALLVTFDGRFPGDLVLPATFSMRYDEQAVAAFGVPETDILLCRFDGSARAWLPIAGQVIDPDLNWIAAPETQNIRQAFAVFASNPAPVAPHTWGAIKALFVPAP
jgi:hypothetical protein